MGFTEAATEMPSMFYCPLSTAKNKLGLGDVVRLRFVPGEKNFVFSVTNLNKEASDKLLKKFTPQLISLRLTVRSACLTMKCF